jgi:hypothetical protein
MEQAIQFTLGVSYLVIGVSCLVHTDAWIAWMDIIREDGRRSAIVMGTIALMVSAFIVGAHPIWSGLPLLVTIIGVLGMIGGYALSPVSAVAACADILFHRAQQTAFPCLERGGGGFGRRYSLYLVGTGGILVSETIIRDVLE